VTTRVHPWRGALGAARRLAAMAGLALGTVAAHAAAPACPAMPWPLWQEFEARFIQPDGRVLDASTPEKHTSSEGQSYGMFFALVADDREQFDRLWGWTVDNLFAGDATARLPAWFWGLAPDGTWRVLDANSASDADLWFVYALLEAGRAWQRPDYTAAAKRLLTRIEQEEVVTLPGLGPMLLPGKVGFATPEGQWRLNASYLPLPLVRRFAAEHPQGPWRAMADETARVYEGGHATGFVADWIGYKRDASGQGHFFTDPVKGDIGSYDAIRTYMWAGMTPKSDPQSARVLQATRGLALATARNGEPPESVTIATGLGRGTTDFGFSAAVLPYLHTTGQHAERDRQLARVMARMDQARAAADGANTQAPYYHYVLSLFSLGWLDGRYRFGDRGSLNLSWKKACSSATAP
jgi:endoglucanase